MKLTLNHTQKTVLSIFGVIIGVVIVLSVVELRQQKPTYVLGDRQIHRVVNELLPLNMRVTSSQGPGISIAVRVADTDKERHDGLSGFISLPEGQGMLFSFPQVGIYPFWMKGMKFPLDILWIDSNGVIVDEIIAMDPSSYPESYTPKAPAQFVLELPANTARRDGFVVGSSIQIQNN